VNQDAFIETEDLTLVYNDNVAGVEGYVVTDLNGDEFTETEDVTLVFNNNVLGIEAQRPAGYPGLTSEKQREIQKVEELKE
jgi:hypothetical protein